MINLWISCVLIQEGTMHINIIKNELQELCSEYVSMLEKLKEKELITEEVFENFISVKKSFLKEQYNTNKRYFLYMKDIIVILLIVWVLNYNILYNKYGNI